MTETQRRIEAYQKALPDIKEKVVAVAMLLALSVIMLTSASFAWLTISRAPEVTAVSTNVAANGNLEIALVNPEGTEPEESKVGDSSATDSNVVRANETWGNLINLSDPSYGLEELVLKPAQLNKRELLESPLFGAEYTDDGRISRLVSDFAYTKWVSPKDGVEGFFDANSLGFGVRAISSVKEEIKGADAEEVALRKELGDLEALNITARSSYEALKDNSDYMNSLSAMIGTYMTASLNEEPDTAFATKDIQNLILLYEDFLVCFDQEADAIAALINFQIKKLELKDPPIYTREMVYDIANNPLPEDVKIKNLSQFISDRNTLVNDVAYLKSLSGTIKYSDLDNNQIDIIGNLVNVGSCTINGKTMGQWGTTGLASLVLQGGTKEAVITNGILKNFENRTGGRLVVKEMKIKAKYLMQVTVTANVSTDATEEYFADDLDYAKSLVGEMGEPKLVAQDTYGLAVDLWVRTNAQGSYLILEGNVLTETNNVEVTGKDANGNTVDIYTITRTVGEGEEATEVSYDVYEGEVENQDGTKTNAWFYADSHTQVTLEDGEEPTRKIDQVVTIIGYEGENRIWDTSDESDKSYIGTDATTQGNGSCYVYYADTPEDQAQSLKLLEAFKVAFIDGRGNFLAMAEMDTERFFAQNGRVVVPLVLSQSESLNIGEDNDGNDIYAITDLKKNVATRITAIVYLDGTELTNDEVLAAANIQGKLNIQFGSSQKMKPIDNEKLEGDYRTVTASVDKTSFKYEEASEINPMKVNVTVNVDGTVPGTVKAFFIRQINATQGSREDTMFFTKQDDGSWKAEHTFMTPGNYILRSVELDGQEYELETKPTVTIEGFTITQVSYNIIDGEGVGQNHLKIMTANSSGSVGLTVGFASNDVNKMPKTVQGRFLREDGSAVNVNFTLDSNTGLWNGKANFITSGDYTMQYLVLDGEYNEIPTAMQKTADITLGMRVAVYTTSPTSFDYNPAEMTPDQKVLKMEVQIFDNAGEELGGLGNVKLVYRMRGSATKTMDADLVWNGNYYVGSLTAYSAVAGEGGGPGVWNFGNVMVGANNLTTATTAPTFTIRSLDPPEYSQNLTDDYQYSPDKKAVMNVAISNSDSATTVKAYFAKQDSNGNWVETGGAVPGTALSSGDGRWSFTIPQVNEYQDGRWKLLRVELAGVYDEDAKFYDDDNPYEIDVSDENVVTKAVNRIFVSFTGEGKVLGKDSTEKVTGAFLQSYPDAISGLSVTIKDFENVNVAESVDALVVYKNNTSTNKGGYSHKTLKDSRIQYPVTFTENEGVFNQSADVALQYAGEYTTELEFKVDLNGDKYDLSLDSVGVELTVNGKQNGSLPTYEIWSIAPTVEITGINRSGKFDVDKTDKCENDIGGGFGSYVYFPNNNSHGTSDKNATYSSTSATVCFGCSTSQAAFGLAMRTHNYTQPTVTMKISGFGNAASAKLAFIKVSDNSTALIYESNGGTTVKGSFDWTSNSVNCTRYIGYFVSQENSTDVKITAGEIKATELVLKDSAGNELVVDITDITINNPY